MRKSSHSDSLIAPGVPSLTVSYAHSSCRYGIKVNFRHLSLIGDYMTFLGTLRPLNRAGMDMSTSPFLKMSFETTCRFLTEATISERLLLAMPLFPL